MVIVCTIHKFDSYIYLFIAAQIVRNKFLTYTISFLHFATFRPLMLTLQLLQLGEKEYLPTLCTRDLRAFLLTLQLFQLGRQGIYLPFVLEISGISC
jgi:hypothetical protein